MDTESNGSRRVRELKERIERVWLRQQAAERDVQNYRKQRYRLEDELHRERQYQARVAAVEDALRKAG